MRRASSGFGENTGPCTAVMGGAITLCACVRMCDVSVARRMGLTTPHDGADTAEGREWFTD
jgi:hypothetical protein